MKVGSLIEKKFSLNIGSTEIPFLISEKLLRDKNLGQIDFSKYELKKKVIYIYELKSRHYPQSKQIQRLKRTQDFLAKILELEVQLKIRLCQKTNDSLFY